MIYFYRASYKLRFVHFISLFLEPLHRTNTTTSITTQNINDTTTESTANTTTNITTKIVNDTTNDSTTNTTTDR